jgi:DNA-binding Lrp family transcriptional regulator
MAKSNRETMKKDEIQVLTILEQHAKESIDYIAKKCGFSRQKVWKIIKNLEEKKIIWGYTAITDETLRNLKHYVLLVKRNTVPFDASFKKEIVFERLDNYQPGASKIEDIFFTHGDFDGVVTFYAPDLISAKKMVQEISRRIGKYFKEYRLLTTLFPIRKKGLKNPQIKELIEYM